EPGPLGVGGEKGDERRPPRRLRRQHVGHATRSLVVGHGGPGYPAGPNRRGPGLRRSDLAVLGASPPLGVAPRRQCPHPRLSATFRRPGPPKNAASKYFVIRLTSNVCSPTQVRVGRGAVFG